MREYKGQLDARGRRFAIVASRFNEFIVDALVRGAEGALIRLGSVPDAVDCFHVPGAFELATVAGRAARSGRYDAVICLGAVIRGATPHFDQVARESAREIAELSARSDVPVIYGVLTTDTIEQAIERAGTKAGNKGADAAFAAVEMISLLEAIEHAEPPAGFTASGERGASRSSRGSGGARQKEGAARDAERRTGGARHRVGKDDGE